MNKWIKIVTPALLAAVITALLLILSGLGTTSLTDNDYNVITQTTIKLEVNAFATVMIAGVAVTVLFTGILMQSTDKPAPAVPQPEQP